MEEAKASSELLHFGQLISICLEDNCYIYSKGFIDNSVYVIKADDNSSHDFIGSIFRVLPQCMYSVQNNLISSCEEFSQQHFQDKFKRHEESFEGELKTNIQTYSNFKGEPVRFGSIIQLQHVLSYKFITLVPQENAEIEKENLKLRLTEFASECSYIRVETAYKFQKESDGLVRINDRVVFEILLPDLIKSAYFNTSEFSTPGFDIEKREVNASLDHNVKWKLQQYSKFIPDRENSLLCGDHVWISHGEEESCLVANSRNEGMTVFFNSNMNDTNGLWKIESENDREGGYVTAEKNFRLRHASSGMYLGMVQSSGDKLGGVDGFSKALLSKMARQSKFVPSLEEKSSPYTLWRFQSLHDNKKSRKISRDDYCILINSSTTCYLQGVEDKKIEQSSKLIPVIKTEPPSSSSQPIKNEDAYFKLFKCEDSLIWGTLFLLDCMPILKEVPILIEKYSQIPFGTENLYLLREFKKKTDLVLKCLDNLILFCKNKLKSMITVDKQFGHVEGLRQKILREQLFIEVLAEILDTIFIGNFSLSKVMMLNKMENSESGGRVTRTSNLAQEITRTQLLSIVLIAKKIYELLAVICKGNKENQAYSFRFFRVFQKHAAYGLGATQTMMTILDENETLLLQLHKSQNQSNERVNDSIIGHYSWLLRVRTI